MIFLYFGAVSSKRSRVIQGWPQKMPSELCDVNKIHDNNKRDFKIPTTTENTIVYLV